jgi:hypothetical protein
VLLLMLQMIGSLIGLWAAQRIPQPSTDIHRKRPAGGLAGPRRGPRSERR